MLKLEYTGNWLHHRLPLIKSSTVILNSYNITDTMPDSHNDDYDITTYKSHAQLADLYSNGVKR